MVGCDWFADNTSNAFLTHIENITFLFFENIILEIVEGIRNEGMKQLYILKHTLKYLYKTNTISSDIA